MSAGSCLVGKNAPDPFGCHLRIFLRPDKCKTCVFFLFSLVVQFLLIFQVRSCHLIICFFCVALAQGWLEWMHYAGQLLALASMHESLLWRIQQPWSISFRQAPSGQMDNNTGNAEILQMFAMHPEKQPWKKRSKLASNGIRSLFFPLIMTLSTFWAERISIQRNSCSGFFWISALELCGLPANCFLMFLSEQFI